MGKKIACVVVCFLLAVGAMSMYYFSSISWDNVLSTQQRDLDSLQNNINVRRLTVTEQEQTVVKNTTGYDYQRVQKDDAVAEEFLKQVMSWDTYAEYQEIREACKHDYQIDESSNFLTVFFPDIPVVTAPNGDTYNLIDDGSIQYPDGFNIHYESMTSYVSAISTEKYSYYAFVKWSTQTEKGHEGISTAVFIYDVDTDGKISNIDAYALAN